MKPGLTSGTVASNTRSSLGVAAAVTCCRRSAQWLGRRDARFRTIRCHRNQNPTPRAQGRGFRDGDLRECRQLAPRRLPAPSAQSPIACPRPDSLAPAPPRVAPCVVSGEDRLKRVRNTKSGASARERQQRSGARRGMRACGGVGRDRRRGRGGADGRAARRLAGGRAGVPVGRFFTTPPGRAPGGSPT